MNRRVTENAYAIQGEFACLEVVAICGVGAFLDVGMEKDLLLPFREQTRSLEAGDWVVVFLFKDNTNRDCASMRIDKFLEPESTADYQVDERVELLIANRTDLGYRAIIENRHIGILYSNEIFRPLRIGDRMVGYIKNVRPDGKIDLTLQRNGNKEAKSIGDAILEAIEADEGFLALHDGSHAEDIYDRFGVSKKKFKMAVGALYKQGLIALDDDGLRLA